MSWFNKLSPDYWEPNLGTPLHSETILSGSPIGLLLSLTYAEDVIIQTGGTGTYWQHSLNTEWEQPANE